MRKPIAVFSLLLLVASAAECAVPRVTTSVPVEGATNVDPATKQIVITFDTAMKTDGFSVLQAPGGAFPQPAGDRPFRFRDPKTFVMNVRLEPGTGYAFRLNSESRQGFRSADGTVLPPTVIRFQTRGTKQTEPKSPKERGLGYVDDDDFRPTRGLKLNDASQPSPPKQEHPLRQGHRKEQEKGPRFNLPSGWVMIDDKLFGTQVAVPPGWSPRVRGDVAYCIEPDAVPKAGVFFVPILLKGQTTPQHLADGFDNMLRRALPNLQTQDTGRPTPESLQRDLAAEISGTAVAGAYRAVVSRAGTGFVMGYLAPRAQLDTLRPTFFKVLASYRYTGPKLRLRPFKSAAIELRIPEGWQVQTSEGQSPKHDIDWMATCPQVPGAKVFMFSPKYISSGWVSNAFTGQPDPSGLAIWQGKGFQLANFQTDEQALQQSLVQVMPGLQIQQQQNLEEIRQLLNQVFGEAIRTIYATGGRMTWYAFEIIGRRQVEGVELKSILTLGLCSMYTPGGVKGTLGMWQAQVRGYEAPVSHFAQLSPTMDRVNSSFSYTLWWIKAVQKANEHQARVIKRFWEQSNRIDREIWDNRMKTQGAISEMMYDNLTENYGYVNKETGSIEKIPVEHLERFRREDGEIVSPEDVIEKQIPIEQARPLREAFSNDYMSFDRRVQVWP